tara:strand:- start:734 stop:1078 length:345 start_codon:yes stop_codon:yes gene_type:complete
MLKMLLYHGTTLDNALSILKNGFDINKAGNNWGITYGKGIYFSPNYETAYFYANNNMSKPGIVISVNIDLVPYILKKDISPNQKKKFKLPKDKDYDSIISPNGDEVIIINDKVF